MNIKEPILHLRDSLKESYETTVLRGYYNLFGHEVNTRFAIVGNARTGSNYLLDGLNSSSCVKMYHEIFADHHRDKGKDFEKILSLLYQRQDKAISVVGFKLFYNHLTPEEWEKFVAHGDFKIIHLTRRNRLRTIVSLDVAFKTGQWTKSQKSIANRPVDKRIFLDPLTLVQRLARLEADEALARDRLKGREMIEVVYEKLVAQPAEVFGGVGAYLGVRDIDPDVIKISRQNPEGLEQIIMNYEEVCHALDGTDYAEYIKN
ncbi:MAG: Stf0 family sulfotransferase [Chloroflexota bacterium]